eukprot:9442635-Pyramimonas_sp.AAC.1
MHKRLLTSYNSYYLISFAGPPAPVTARMRTPPRDPSRKRVPYIYGTGSVWGVECTLAVIGTGGPAK